MNHKLLTYSLLFALLLALAAPAFPPAGEPEPISNRACPLVSQTIIHGVRIYSQYCHSLPLAFSRPCRLIERTRARVDGRRVEYRVYLCNGAPVH